MAAEVHGEGESIGAALRRHTRVDHEALHRLPLFVALRAGALSIDGYGRLMRRLHHFHAGFETVTEEALQRHSECFGGYARACRADLIARDLASLGQPAPETAGLSMAPPVSAAELAGMLYVVDGSMLGAATLCDQARKVAGPRGTGYWLWCRRDGVRLWAALCSVLPSLATGDRHRAEMLASARRTFRAFGETFAEPIAATGQG